MTKVDCFVLSGICQCGTCIARHFDRYHYSRFTQAMVNFSEALMKFLKVRALTLIFVRTRFRNPLDGKLEDTVVVQGGAGDVPENMMEKRLEGVQNAVVEGFIALKETGNVLDAVEKAVKMMESHESFNAGIGSYLNENGEAEMDASIMSGVDLSAGAVCTLTNIKHPITLARLFMVKTKDIVIVGHGAMKFARENGVTVLPPDSVIVDHVKKYWETNKTVNPEEAGSVGAIAMDKNGNMAAGTSTGGLNRRMAGHVSDSAAIGCGAYADNSWGAVCCSGNGAGINKTCLAYSIALSTATMPVMEAIQFRLTTLKGRLNHTAGAIVLSKTGEIGINFTTKRMPWAYQRKRTIYYGINPDERLEANM